MLHVATRDIHSSESALRLVAKVVEILNRETPPYPWIWPMRFHLATDPGSMTPHAIFYCSSVYSTGVLLNTVFLSMFKADKWVRLAYSRVKSWFACVVTNWEYLSDYIFVIPVNLLSFNV